MTVPMYTIKLRAGKPLIDRVEAAAQELGVAAPDFIQYAIETALRRHAIHQIREDIAVEEIRRNIVASAQAASVQLEEERDELVVCQLCLTPFPRLRREAVEGPVLCDDCLSLAKGGDFSRLDSEDI